MIGTSFVVDNLVNFFIEWDFTLFDTNITILNFLMFIIVFAIGIGLMVAIPRNLTIAIMRLIVGFEIRVREKKLGRKLDWAEKNTATESALETLKRTLEKPLIRFISATILLPFLLIAVYALGYDLFTPLDIFGTALSFWSLISFVIVVFIFVIFVRTVLRPLTIAVCEATLGTAMDKRELTSTTTIIYRVVYYLTILAGTYIALDIAFVNKENLPYYQTYIHPIFILLRAVLLVFLATIIILTYFKVKVVKPRRLERHVVVAFENMVKVIAFIIGLGLIFSILGVDLTTIVAVLGIIGFAIAFGMQHAIANIMAGFMLTADKPFVIGDRIRVGEPGRETWGDVVDIGLNTTKIRTVEEEIVVIPNSHIATKEVWNYTRGSPIIAHIFDVSISYGSDWKLAKKIIQGVAEKHPLVRNNPKAFVRIDKFGPSGVELKVWIWINHARDKDQIRSDLLEQIKDRFDAEGVEIPFNYHTIVFKKDVQPEAKLPEDAEFSNIRFYPSTTFGILDESGGEAGVTLPVRLVTDSDVRILTPVSSTLTAEKLAEYSIDLGKKNGGNVTALYVMKEYSEKQEKMGLKALAAFERIGANSGVPVATMIEEGDVIAKILETIEARKIDMVIIGTSRRGLRSGLFAESLAQKIIERSPVPVITVPETASSVFGSGK